MRRREREARAPLADPDEARAPGPGPETSSHVRDAGSRLLQRLAPQERAAIVLKEIFDMSLEEIAALLATTTGAVKSALHRGRGRLREPEGGGKRVRTGRACVHAARLDQRREPRRGTVRIGAGETRPAREQRVVLNVTILVDDQIVDCSLRSLDQ